MGLFDARVAVAAGSVALVCGDVELSYGELDRRANRLARYLIACGVGPEAVVGIVMDRSVELVIALYAVLKAGGAYVPIDPRYPSDRVCAILATARPVCVLASAATSATVTITSVCPVVVLDGLDLAGFSDVPVTDGDRVAVLRPGNPAYVIYTSGSTGTPKGVIITHQA
ncbi:AMP-binding protein, partial [Nocardia sp. R7R-8]|uniref:AMP-binding protein n=1 Tax=Nocardia sp. R7R-8 TaxID=3459304 RepID=UPI00403DEC0D